MPLLTVCVPLCFLNAQPSWVRDAAFGGGSTVRVGGGREEESLKSMALLPGGKILAAGRYGGDMSFVMARYHTNGQLDASFGSNGKTAYDLGRNYGEAKEILLLPDGRFILGATSGDAPGVKEVFSLVRFLPNGSVDVTFGTNGVAKGASSPDLFDKLNAIAMQPDGKILAAGSTNYINGPDSLQSVTLSRFKADGAIDITFGINGVVRLPYPDQYYEFNALAVQPDGRIIAAGSSFDNIIVARFETNGSPDSTFGTNGVKFLQYSAAGKTRCRAVSLLDDGNILLGAWCYDYWFNNGAIAIRLLPDGSPDPTFGNGSISGMAFIHCDYQLNTSSMTLQNDGKIVLAAAGLNNDPWPASGIFRFLPDGTPDSSFAQNGEWVNAVGNENSAWYAVHALPDGRILAGGVSKKHLDCDFTLLRLQNDGTPDPAFGDNGLVVTDFGWGYDWAVSVRQRPDGKVLLAGKAYASSPLIVQDKCVLVQFLADGAPDAGFGNGGRDTFPCGDLKTVDLQQDGKILVGTDSYWDGYVRPVSLFRRLPNGGADSAFGKFGRVDSLFGNYFSPTVIQTGVLSNGKIVAAGRVSRPGTNRDFILTCLNTDGSRDLSFGDNGFVLVDFNNKNDEVYGLTLLPDDKIILGGTALSGSPAKPDIVVMRFNPDGSFDDSWGQNGILIEDFEAPVGEGISYMTLTPEGKLLLAVQRQITIDIYEDAIFDNVLACYNSDGSPDVIFGDAGRVVIPLNAPYAGGQYIRQIRFLPNGKFMTAAELPYASMDYDSFTVEMKRYLPNGSADTFPAAHGVISDKWGDYYGGFAIEMIPAEGTIWLAVTTYFDYQLNQDIILTRYRFEPGCFPVSVQSVSGTGLDDTNVNISPSVSCPAMTLLTGCDDESLCLCGKEAVVVSPNKNDNPLNGVSTYDLVLISRHIIGLGTFTSPYQYIAADANRSGSVTTFDIVEIRKLILGIYQNFPNNTSWRFVRKEYVFPNPANPFNPLFPEKDTVSALDPPARLAYVAVKTGDVNGSQLTGCDNLLEPEPRQSLALSAALCPAAAGDMVTVPVFFAEAADCAAWQCALRFDNAALELVGAQPGDFEGMDANNFGLTNAGRGVLRAIWYSEDGSERRLEAGKILFRVVFRAKKDINPGEVYLSVHEDALASRAYRGDGETIKLSLDHTIQPCATTASARIQVLPNPVSTSVCFKIENNGEGKGVLRIFNTHGTMCFQQTVTYTDSASYCFSETAAWSPGLYTWRFISDAGQTGEGKFLKQ